MGIKTLLISPVPTHPMDAGNRIRIFQLSEKLRASRCDLYFAYYDHEMAGGDYREMRRYWGKKAIFFSRKTPKTLFRFKRVFDCRKSQDINVEKGPMEIDIWNNPAFDDVLLKLHSEVHFQMVWVEYVFLSGILNCFDPSVIKVIDTHDVFSDRDKLFQANNVDPEWFYTNREMEKQGLSRADLVVAIKDADAQFFRRMGLPNVVTIGHLFPPTLRRNGGTKENVCLFMGSDNTSNVKAWQFFTDFVLDKILERVPHVSFHIVGRICNRIPDRPSYKKFGVIPDLDKIYRSAKVAINPVTFGTGLKIKSIEPLAFGCPVVTTPVGIQGIEDAENRGVLVGRTPEEFASHLETLLENSYVYERQREHGLRYMKRYQVLNQKRLEKILSKAGKKQGGRKDGK